MTLLLAAILFAQLETPGGQAFQLGGGEYRWVPFTVKQAPAEVKVRYEVLKGAPTVRAEILDIGEFRDFNRGKPHSVLAETDEAPGGEFRKLILRNGQYAAVIANSPKAPLATVSLSLRVETNPRGAAAKELPQRTRLTIVLLSFGFFIVTAGWSAQKLLRAMRSS